MLGTLKGSAGPVAGSAAPGSAHHSRARGDHAAGDPGPPPPALAEFPGEGASPRTPQARASARRHAHGGSEPRSRNGRTVAVFTLLNRAVLQPLPYPRPDRLVRMWSAVPGARPDARWGLGRPQFFFYRENARSFEQMGLYVIGSVAIAQSGPVARPAEQTEVAYVSASLTEALGARPALGRLLTPADNRRQEPGAALPADHYWRQEFGAEPGIVGRTIPVDGRPVRVVGVLEQRAGFWMSCRRRRCRWGSGRPSPGIPADPPTGGGHVFRAIGRLRPGVTLSRPTRN